MSPPPNAEDLGWWRELLAWIGSGVVAITTGTRIVATRSKDIVATQKALAEAQLLLTERVGSLENVDRDMGRFCSQQRREILDDLRREICQVIQSAMKDAKIEASTDRASMATALALHTQALGNIEKDIKAIFARLDRRHGGETYVPPGRRGTDYDE